MLCPQVTLELLSLSNSRPPLILIRYLQKPDSPPTCPPPSYLHEMLQKLIELLPAFTNSPFTFSFHSSCTLELYLEALSSGGCFSDSHSVLETIFMLCACFLTLCPPPSLPPFIFFCLFPTNCPIINTTIATSQTSIF